VVIAHKPDGISRLYVRRSEGSSFQELAGTEGADYPFWSYDSHSLAFFADRKLKRVDMDDNRPPRILSDAENGRGGSWNRDDVIVFAPNNNGGLFAIQAAGGVAQAVTPKSTVSDRWPHFLEGGRRFLFVRLAGDSAVDGVYVGSLNGEQPRRVIATRSEAVYSDRQLLFVRDGALVAQPFDPIRAVTQPGEVVTIAERLARKNDAGFPFSVSETGVIAYAHTWGVPLSQLTWVDRRGRRLGVVGVSADQHHPEISPDGKNVATFRSSSDAGLASTTVGAAINLWITDLTHGVDTRFTLGQGRQVAPIWSPDGRSIAFSRLDPRSALAVRSSDGTGVEEPLFTDDNWIIASSWSPDGKWLVYIPVRGDSIQDIVTLPLTGERKPIPYLSNGFLHAAARVSPGGHWLAYVGNETGQDEVYVQSFPTPGTRWRVSSDGGSQPRWRSDGRELFYYVSRTHRMVAVAVSTTSGGFSFDSETALFDVNLPAIEGWHEYDVTRDGQRFLLNLPVGEPAPPITVLINWPALITHRQ
jgi:Tol biopolymer transport system component